MDAHVVSLDAQHCLAIAAAFIAIIGACASLISGANSKAESLTTRIHEATKEFREARRKGNSARCEVLEDQLKRFGGRYETVQKAQLLLFVTVCIFVICLTVFIGLSLYGSHQRLPDITEKDFVRNLIVGIGVGVGVGTLTMLLAVGLHFTEVWRSHRTLDIEASDCLGDADGESPADQTRPAFASEMAGGRG